MRIRILWARTEIAIRIKHWLYTRLGWSGVVEQDQGSMYFAVMRKVWR